MSVNVERASVISQADILRAFIDSVSRLGYRRVNLNDIARSLNCDLNVIRRQFSTKEALLLAVFQEYAHLGLQEFKGSQDLESYTFEEKFQLLADTYLEQLSNIRGFVEETVKPFAVAPLTLKKLRTSLAEVHQQDLRLLLKQARDEAELPPLLFVKPLTTVCCDFLFHLTYFWAKDQSEHCSDSSKYIELCTDFLASKIKSGTGDKAMAIIRFGAQRCASEMNEKLECYLPVYKTLKTFFREKPLNER